MAVLKAALYALAILAAVANAMPVASAPDSGELSGAADAGELSNASDGSEHSSAPDSGALFRRQVCNRKTERVGNGKPKQWYLHKQIGVRAAPDSSAPPPRLFQWLTMRLTVRKACFAARPGGAPPAIRSQNRSVFPRTWQDPITG